MAITLITGLPGHGKTLYALQWVKQWAEKEGRAVFHNGIPELALPWSKIDPEDWLALEPGAIVVLDECQANMPVRTRGQPPAWIEELAKHRHRGLDFVLITQNPMLFDSFVRRLVDRHFHVVRKFGTHFATVYEFVNGVRENVAANREGAIRHEWRYPKDVFSLYKSAELHTVKRRIPARVFVLAAVPVVFMGAAWMAWQAIKPAPAGLPAGSAAASAPGAAGLPAPPGRAAPAAPATVSPAQWVANHQPRVPGLAYTAPVYDSVTEPVQAPYPAACIQSASRCKCYTQQATVLDVGDELCGKIAAGGFFVSWQQPAQPAVPVSERRQNAPEPSPQPSLASGILAGGPAQPGAAGPGVSGVQPPMSDDGDRSAPAPKPRKPAGHKP